jgi:hypothetical protein
MAEVKPGHDGCLQKKRTAQCRGVLRRPLFLVCVLCRGAAAQALDLFNQACCKVD